MKKSIHDFEGIAVNPDRFAIYAAAIDRTRQLLQDALEQDGIAATDPKIAILQSDDIANVLRLSSPSSEARSVSPASISQVLNALMVQVGTMCQLDDPESEIEHFFDQYESYYQCGHSDPCHYWDDEGNPLPERP